MIVGSKLTFGTVKIKIEISNRTEIGAAVQLTIAAGGEPRQTMILMVAAAVLEQHDIITVVTVAVVVAAAGIIAVHVARVHPRFAAAIEVVAVVVAAGTAHAGAIKAVVVAAAADDLIRLHQTERPLHLECPFFCLV